MIGDWISVRAQAERRPARLILTITFGDLPEGWTRKGGARTWVGLLGLLCVAPFVVLIAATLLNGAGVHQPYAWISASEIAIVAATISLFVGIPVAIAITLWRIGRLGLRRRDGVLEGLIALEFAPLHLVVLLMAIAVGGLFVGHLAVDSFACVHGVHSAC